MGSNRCGNFDIYYREMDEDFMENARKQGELKF
jgi:hypothetical protein